MTDLLLKYARLGIYIELVPDCFKLVIDKFELNERQVCWRPIINYYWRGGWDAEDCGCSQDIEVALQMAERSAEVIYQDIYNGVPLNFTKVKPLRVERP